MNRCRVSFPDPLPCANPMRETLDDHQWSAVLLYVNDPASTLESTGRQFLVSRERVRYWVQLAHRWYRAS